MNLCHSPPTRITPLSIQLLGTLHLNWCLDTPPPYLLLTSEPSPQYNYDDYVSELKRRLHTAHHVAKKNLIDSKFRNKDYYDNGTEEMKIEVGEKDLLHDEIVRRDRSLKLSSQWIGPYEVVEVYKVNATIKKGRKLIKVHVNRLKSFY